MIIGGDGDIEPFFVDFTEVEQVTQFNFLSSILSSILNEEEHFNSTSRTKIKAPYHSNRHSSHLVDFLYK